MAAQLTLMKRPARRAEKWWIACATSSLPVPVPTVKLQTPNELCRVSSVAAQIDQREGERALRERLHGFARGRDGDALVATDPQKAEESQLSCRIDFDHECSSFSHHEIGAGEGGKRRTRNLLWRASVLDVTNLAQKFLSHAHATRFIARGPMVGSPGPTM